MREAAAPIADAGQSLCPVNGCKRNRRSGQLMCLTHWRRVPRETQERVYSTYRAYYQTPVIPIAAFSIVNKDRIEAANTAIKKAGEPLLCAPADQETAK